MSTTHAADPNWRFAQGWKKAHYFEDRTAKLPSSLCGAHGLPELNYPCLTPDADGCKACWEKWCDRIGAPRE